jgi:single-strand DNA-binding protein
MAKGLNRVQIIGHLGADPDVRALASGQTVANFRVAVNRRHRDQQGQAIEEAEWFRCVAFDRLGEIAGEYLQTGAHVYVDGRLQARKYTDRDGVERTVVEIIANDLILLDSRHAGAPVGDAAADEVPF